MARSMAIGAFLQGRCFAILLLLAVGALPLHAQPLLGPTELAAVYASAVDRRLDLPPDEARRYGEMLQSSLSSIPLQGTDAQYVVLVDRNPRVQALMIYWRPAQGPPRFVGASPVSTGRAGGFEHFLTPLGVFEHTLTHPDFRAEGTRNENGIRGYGVRGMRVFDFGWQPERKTWGNRALSSMRLQIHATDPEHLESRLGTAQSKGCIRIPASLNKLIDQYGLLDADYERAMQEGDAPWVLHPRRTPTSWSGRYLVVVESQRNERPAWSPAPASGKTQKTTAGQKQAG